MRKPLFAISAAAAVLAATTLAGQPAMASTASTAYFTAGVYQRLAGDGAWAVMTIAKPFVASEDEDSYAAVQIFTPEGLNGLEFGWMVNRAQGDAEPHLLARTYTNNVPNCLNCDFVPTGRRHHLGDTLPPGDGTFTIQHVADRWWVAYAGERVGYVPDNLWTEQLKGDKVAVWGAETDVASATKPCTDMGNGKPASSPAAARMHIGFIGAELTEVSTTALHPQFYSVSTQGPTHFRFGGPGAC